MKKIKKVCKMIPPEELAHKEPTSEEPPKKTGPAMDFKDRHTQYGPSRIFVFDNGTDCTFKGMGLKGNR
jgi:hypothetical protein